MGPRAFGVSSTLATREHGRGSIVGALVPILLFKDGGHGGLPPRVASPSGGERGPLITITEVPGHIETRISTEQKNEDFQTLISQDFTGEQNGNPSVFC